MPQMERNTWLNLNGLWDFAFDFGQSGTERKFYEKGTYSQQIMVPFCPESKLSKIEYKDFIPAIWYRRFAELTEEQLCGHIFLHFGAVDYKTTVYINGTQAGCHEGGIKVLQNAFYQILKSWAFATPSSMILNRK